MLFSNSATSTLSNIVQTTILSEDFIERLVGPSVSVLIPYSHASMVLKTGKHLHTLQFVFTVHQKHSEKLKQAWGSTNAEV